LGDVQLASRARERSRSGDGRHQLQVGPIHTGIVS
jgi:hypothetical protein